MLYFNYRGSWGSPGDFSFSHSIEDTLAAADYLRQPAVTKLLRLDPSDIVLIGHSMGGFMAVQGAAADSTIAAIGLISAADLGGRIPQPLPKEGEATAIQALSAGYAHEGMAPLRGCTPEGLAHETLANAAGWNFLAKVDSLKTRPALIVTSDDGLAARNDTFAAALRNAGDNRVTLSTCLPTTLIRTSASPYRRQFSSGSRSYHRDPDRVGWTKLPAHPSLNCYPQRTQDGFRPTRKLIAKEPFKQVLVASAGVPEAEATTQLPSDFAVGECRGSHVYIDRTIRQGLNSSC